MPNLSQAPEYWRRNLLVSSLGAFTTVIGMTLVLPILPLFVQDLGVTDTREITTFSGLAYAGTFLTAGLTAPLWGRLGDKYGRKSMLIRASLGMAVAMSLIGFAQNVWQLVALRLLAGLLAGYASGATILVADQAPQNRSAWALGVLSSAIMAGNVAGPMLGGVLTHAFGVKNAFLAVGALIFIAFLGTAFFLKEQPKAQLAQNRAAGSKPSFAALPHRGVILAMLGLSTLLMFATISVEPIITVHVEKLAGTASNLALTSATVFSLTALGTVISGPQLGKLADKFGHLNILTWCPAATTVLLALQAVANNLWVFATLRFLTGIALGGVTPSVIATIRRMLPKSSVGLVLGYNVSAQYLGQVTGPIVAGVLGGIAGTSSVFVMTAVLTACGILAVLGVRGKVQAISSAP